MERLTTKLSLKEEEFESKTYRLYEEKVEGFTDGILALKQAIYKILSTEQYEYPIYSFDYGINWKALIGEERPYVRAEMKRMIQEALLQDDRITETDGFNFDFLSDCCHCSFHVISIYGEFDVETEVAV